MTAETVRLLVALAERAGLRERIAAMFAGQRINLTEDRAVLHVALRAPQGSQVLVDGHDVVPEVHAVLARMRAFAEQVRPWPGDGLYEVVVLERPLDMPWSPSLAGGASTGRRQRSVHPRDRAHDCRRWDRCHCGALHRNGGHIGVCCFVLDGLSPYPYVHVGGLGVRGSAALKGRAE